MNRYRFRFKVNVSCDVITGNGFVHARNLSEAYKKAKNKVGSELQCKGATVAICSLEQRNS